MITPETFARQFLFNCKDVKLNEEELSELIRLFEEAEHYYARLQRPRMTLEGFKPERKPRIRSIRKPRV